MTENNNIDGILDDIKTKVENGIPIGTHEYLDYAAKLIALSQELDESIILAEMTVNRRRAELMSVDGHSAASAKELVKSDDIYGTWMTLVAKKERVYAQVQIAKKRVEALV